MSTHQDFRRVLIVGAGTMGWQISLHAARFGREVALYDVDPAAFERCRKEQTAILDSWVSQGTASIEEIAAIRDRIRFEPDATRAARDVDLLIECVPESIEVKRATFSQFEPLCPPHVVFTTNTSYFTPTMLLEGVSRRSQFAALHFYEPVWYAALFDVMPHPGTDPAVVDRLVAFGRSLELVPIVCHAERPGYLANEMLQAVLSSALELAADGIADAAAIDRAWMGMTKMPIGPFGIFDRIGIDTACHVSRYWRGLIPTPEQVKRTEFLQRQVAAGRLGMAAGRGFYDYPNPAYAKADFLDPQKAPAETSLDASAEPPVAEVVLGPYARRVAGPMSFVAHAAVHFGVAWALYRGLPNAPAFGFPSVMALAALAVAFVAPVAAMNGSFLAAKVLGRPIDPPPSKLAFLPSRDALGRSLLACAVGLGCLGLAAAAIYPFARNAVIPVAAAIAGNAAFAGILGFTIQTAIAQRLGQRHGLGRRPLAKRQRPTLSDSREPRSRTTQAS